MVPTKDLQSLQQRCLWNSPCSNNTTYFAQPRPSAFGYLGLKADKLDAVQGHFQPLIPHLENFAPTSVPYSGGQAAPQYVHSSVQKRFLIFDQSGKDIRLFSSAFHFSSQNQAIMPNVPAGPRSLHDEKLNVGEPSLMKLITQTELGENYTSSESGDIREDTEEINALLSFYMEEDDDDHNDDDDDGENDELTSTGHSPFATIGGVADDGKVWELTEEVDSTDGSTKRQKLLDGAYKKSSFGFGSSNYGDDVESSCAKSKELDEDADSILSIRQRQAKIQEKLRILETILPGFKSKDPVLIIDEAINYLKSLRQKAKAMGV